MDDSQLIDFVYNFCLFFCNMVTEQVVGVGETRGLNSNVIKSRDTERSEQGAP
jgi:hypothetical protein